MAQELADDGKPKACAGANRREGVPKIMDAHPLEPRVSLNRSPGLLKIGARPIRVQSGDDEVATSLAIPQEVDGSRAHHNGLSTGFAVGQVDEPSLQIDMAPLEGQNLPQSRARKHEETKRENDLRRENGPSVFFPRQMLAPRLVGI